jgi:glycosyltransferase involved in cell wall biosynthesis
MSSLEAPASRSSRPTPRKQPIIFLAVTYTAKSKARTGIQTVVRSLISALAAIGTELCLVRRPKWGRHFSSLSAQQFEALGCPRARDGVSGRQLKGSWLLVPEVVYSPRDHRIMLDAQRRGMRVAAIFHDAIPISHPTLVRREAAKHHATYMKVLTGADLLIAVSNTAANQFRDFARSRGLSVPQIQVCSLPGEILGVPRQCSKSRPRNGPVRMLCVSTLDPRKNHDGLIRAFNLACSSIPQANLFLDIAGAPYKNAYAIVQAIQHAAKANRRITWHGSVSAEELFGLYSGCDFTVYPSVVEGFGLPILESLWYGRPCICANFGAMAETAAGGGCSMIDVRDSEQLGRAIVALATQPKIRDRLASEIERRRFKYWSEYASELCDVLSAPGDSRMALNSSVRN